MENYSSLPSSSMEPLVPHLSEKALYNFLIFLVCWVCSQVCFKKRKFSFRCWVSAWWKFCGHKPSILPVWGLISSSVIRKKYRHRQCLHSNFAALFFIPFFPSLLPLPYESESGLFIEWPTSWIAAVCSPTFPLLLCSSLYCYHTLPKKKKPSWRMFLFHLKNLCWVPIVYWIKSKLTEVS